MKTPKRFVPFRWLLGAAIVLSNICISYAQTTAPAPAQPKSAANNTGEVVTLDALEVTAIGAELRSREEVENRRNSLGVVDTLTMDDLGDLADDNLADAMVRLPGVSTMQTLYGEQEASYVSHRGISPDLNYVSFDGIAMFSTANNGDGLRRVDLNLIPTQISRTTRVYKTFTADLDAGAIGGVTNIEPYSALNGRETGYITARLTQETGTGKYVPGVNSLGNYKDDPLGKGAKGLWVKRFGANEQFGLVLSGMFRERNYDYTKRNPNGRAFYRTTGATASADLSNWDGLHPFPTLYRPMDYTKYSETHGGSAQFEYRISEDWQVSLLGFGYKQIEDQNLNMFYVESYSGLVRPSPEEGTFKIGRIRPSFSYDRFEQETRGLIAKAVGKLSSDSTLELRAGRYTNEFYDLDMTTLYSYNPPASYITFDMSDVVDQVTISNYDPLVNIANYRMFSAADNETRSKVDSKEVRVDYRKNYSSNSRGFGFTVGADLRETSAQRDRTNITYVSNSSALGDMGIVPDFLSHNYGYPVVWIDYAKFQSQVKPGLAINANTSNNNSWSGDYFYEEKVSAAYVSVKYGMPKTQLIAGLRYDHVKFDALSPLNATGSYDGTFAPHSGGYDYLLPSATLTHSFTSELRLKAGFSQTLGRPQFDDIARAETRNDQNLTLARGNPDLKPRRSDNFDLALEYFWGNNGLVSVGAFYKGISDDIYNLASDQDIGGVTYRVTQPSNSATSKMRGVELVLMHDAIPGLPGLLEKRVGVSLNYTRLWGEMDYLSGTTFVHLDALQYQPDWLANATVFFKFPKRKGEIRVSYNWKGESPISLGAYPWITYWLREQEMMNVSFRYSITKNIILKLQANNLTNEPVQQGYQDPYEMNRYEMGRDKTFLLDLTYKF